MDSKETSLGALLALLPPSVKANIVDIITASGEVGVDAGTERPAGQLPHLLDLSMLDAARLKLLSRTDLDHLTTHGWLVRDKFIAETRQAAAEARSLHADGRLRPAAMKAAPLNTDTDAPSVPLELVQQAVEAQQEHKGRWQRETTRGDRILWLHGATDTPANLTALIAAVDAVRLELNAAVGFDSHAVQVQLACYEGNGRRYVRHRDTFSGGPKRRLTAIVYLNEDWQPDHGGQLRLYTATGVKDVEPLNGRLVLFYSSYLDHEVLPAHANRYALTLWFG